jgi:hypothetical protein
VTTPNDGDDVPASMLTAVEAAVRLDAAHNLPVSPAMTISELARLSGLSRPTVRKRLQQGWSPADLIPVEPVEIPQCLHEVSTPSTPLETGGGRHWLLGLTSGALGIAIAGVGLIVNARYGASLGRTADESVLLAALGLTIDGAAVILLSISALLWKDRHWLFSLVAFVAWIGAAAWSMIATAGFTSQLIGDATAARGAVIEQAADLRTQRADAIAIAKMAVASAIAARDQECGKVGPNCRQRVAELNQRQAELSAAIAAPAIASASVGTADPGAHVLAGFLGVSEQSIQKARIAGLTIAPATAGLFLAFAAVLLGHRRR